MKNMKILVLCAAVAAVFLGLCFVSWLIRRRNAKKEMERNAEDKLREEALDRVLTDGRKQEKVSANVPFDVKYDLDKRKKARGEEHQGVSEIMVQMTESSELSTRKYMFHITDRITLGSKAGENDIVITSAHVSGRQCELFRIGRELFVKNVGKTGSVQLYRKNRQMTVAREAVQLKNHDELRVGDFHYQITIL